MCPTGKFVFCARKIFFPMQFARLEKPASHLLAIWHGTFFKYIFQILRAWSVVARMAGCLRSEYLQRALHTFQSGSYVCTINYSESHFYEALDLQ